MSFLVRRVMVIRHYGAFTVLQQAFPVCVISAGNGIGLLPVVGGCSDYAPGDVLRVIQGSECFLLVVVGVCVDSLTVRVASVCECADYEQRVLMPIF